MARIPGSMARIPSSMARVYLDEVPSPLLIECVDVSLAEVL